MPSASRLFLDRFQRGTHPVASGFPPEHEPPVPVSSDSDRIVRVNRSVRNWQTRGWLPHHRIDDACINVARRDFRLSSCVDAFERAVQFDPGAPTCGARQRIPTLPGAASHADPSRATALEPTPYEAHPCEMRARRRFDVFRPAVIWDSTGTPRTWVTSPQLPHIPTPALQIPH